MKKSKVKKIFGLMLLIIFGFLVVSYHLQKEIVNIYQNRESLIIKDRYNKEICILPNQNGYWARYLKDIPPKFKELLLKKEDKYFYLHFGFNPWSILQAGLSYLDIGERKASSTISQQLVKILLEKEFERSFKNKIIEAFYTLSLEIYHSKEDILKMYVNSAYFGNRAQGISETSQLYFGVTPDLLTDGQILQLLSTLSNPNVNNPARLKNKEISLSLAKKFGFEEKELFVEDPEIINKNMEKYEHSGQSYFEIFSILSSTSKNQFLTIDKELTDKIRAIVRRNINEFKTKNAKNAAVVVMKLPENELLALIGSPDPWSLEEGYKINMVKEPRPIGSTVKPFIYLKAFEEGLRPYTLVEDREYKYITAIGFPLYPKNFDRKYRGEVNLHYALSNSLNVPTVKVLEYISLENFYNFLEENLGFQPIQSLDNYQLGIALGTLEMNLLDLARYFTIFPNGGVLKELRVVIAPENPAQAKKIVDEKYVQLINKILSDRKTGVEQFGLKSWLNLFQENYALKTGTSRSYLDSWIVGYTPDFLIGVWVGNADNTPMDEVSGQIGAGRIWAQIMELLFNSQYNKKTNFKFDLIKEFNKNGNTEYGLADDDYEKFLNALKEKDSSIILTPHNGDIFLLEKNTKITLKAKENVGWFVNEESLGPGENILFIPQRVGQYQIKAENLDGLQQTINIWLSE